MTHVFKTTNLKRYQFPTHINDLVFDRSQATSSEAFIVVLKPRQAPPLHKHDDTEQVYYILEGSGTLTIGKDRRQQKIEPGDVVVVPPVTWHSIQAGDHPVRYLAIDCFCSERKKLEPTWDDHVKTLCKEQGWNYDEVTHRHA